MEVNGTAYRSIWLSNDGWAAKIIDQTKLPHLFEIVRLETLEQAAIAIEIMQVRGAPLIGATAAYGIALALKSGVPLSQAEKRLRTTRPTAINLHWAIDLALSELSSLSGEDQITRAYQVAAKICDDDVETNRSIGEHGLSLIEDIASAKKAGPVNILTHCNAGWIATVDYGTALSPIYQAFDKGIDVHVWVDETRPHNQGAALTAWELSQHGVPHTIVCDNTGGHLMQHGMVDICITGTDRTAANGDVANKIGTYLKALAAKDNGVPFYVALPSTTIDWMIKDGVRDIPIELRDEHEVTHVEGRLADGRLAAVQVAASGSPAANYAFDVTPARLVSGLITERGICDASTDGLASLFPEKS